jgi:hypothetical protein
VGSVLGFDGRGRGSFFLFGTFISISKGSRREPLLLRRRTEGGRRRMKKKILRERNIPSP